MNHEAHVEFLRKSVEIACEAAKEACRAWVRECHCVKYRWMRPHPDYEPREEQYHAWYMSAEKKWLHTTRELHVAMLPKRPA